jgi:hypothetical protein
MSRVARYLSHKTPNASWHVAVGYPETVASEYRRYQTLNLMQVRMYMYIGIGSKESATTNSRGVEPLDLTNMCACPRCEICAYILAIICLHTYMRFTRCIMYKSTYSKRPTICTCKARSHIVRIHVRTRTNDDAGLHIKLAHGADDSEDLGRHRRGQRNHDSSPCNNAVLVP